MSYVITRAARYLQTVFANGVNTSTAPFALTLTHGVTNGSHCTQAGLSGVAAGAAGAGPTPLLVGLPLQGRVFSFESWDNPVPSGGHALPL